MIKIKGRNIVSWWRMSECRKNGEVEISIKSAIVSAISDNYLK